MRTTSIVAVIPAAMLVIGCSQPSLPTTSSPLGAREVPPASSTIRASVMKNGGGASNTTIPIPANTLIFDKCTGELVHVAGTIHLVTQLTEDAASGAHLEMHFNVEDVSGIGLTTGTQYRGVHNETHNSNASESGASEVTTRIDIKLISEGSSDNLVIRDALIHATINADGVVTAAIDNLTVGECR